MSKQQRWKRKHWKEYEGLKEPMKAILNGAVPINGKKYLKSSFDISKIAEVEQEYQQNVEQQREARTGISRALPRYRD